jgi:hypothetical protein
LAVSVAQAKGPNESNSLMMHKELLGKVSENLYDPETELELIPRLAATHAQGILHTAHEENASLIVMGWRGKRTFRESVLGSVLDEVIWGSDTPVVAGKISLPLNSMQRVIFIVPAKAVPPIALRRMLEANLAIAKALNTPLHVHADKSYLQTFDALFAIMDIDQEVKLDALRDQLKPEKLEFDALSNFIILPGFGSRKRVADTLGNLPEQLAAAFDGNLVILHFDK